MCCWVHRDGRIHCHPLLGRRLLELTSILRQGVGASPDGIVDDEVLVEVKCPASAIKTPIAEMVKKGPGNFFLCKWKDRVPIETSELSAAKRRKLEASTSAPENTQDRDKEDELVLDLRNQSSHSKEHSGMSFECNAGHTPKGRSLYK
ncbi:hypothetical protein CAPTEDRAFT_217290 [Capitella teleta]|uniref:YqaJ viral recombinase domain-containing protein n=1 Tax=Capitella teleta TaxID=283909 RepID=R7V792_CAPTE|nr:hypothetical protein CAPTEDRAFT_217290 [Capitella teleta]|eukprot:ELU14327.1 hypothetical protein CAPTEDRAFT_217290 [Capitella teleta]